MKIQWTTKPAERIALMILSHLTRTAITPQKACEQEKILLNAIQEALNKNASLFLEQIVCTIDLKPTVIKDSKFRGQLVFTGSLRASILVGFLWAALNDDRLLGSMETLLRISQQCCEKFSKEMALESMPVDALNCILFELNNLSTKWITPSESLLETHKSLIQTLLRLLSKNPSHAHALWARTHEYPDKKNAIRSLYSTWEKDKDMMALIEEIKEKIEQSAPETDSSDIDLNPPEWSMTQHSTMINITSHQAPDSTIEALERFQKLRADEDNIETLPKSPQVQTLEEEKAFSDQWLCISFFLFFVFDLVRNDGSLIRDIFISMGLAMISKSVYDTIRLRVSATNLSHTTPVILPESSSAPAVSIEQAPNSVCFSTPLNIAETAQPESRLNAQPKP